MNKGEEVDKIGESTREIAAVAASRWVEKVLRRRLEAPILILSRYFSVNSIDFTYKSLR